MKILIIDDDKLIHKVITKKLSEHFDFIHAYNGAEGIMMAQSKNPDAILLDVEMPGRNGYEVCELLRANDITAELPILFLSAKSDIQKVMLGYEAGADDYIVKPFDCEVLKSKINVVIKYRLEKLTLSQQVEEAQDTAMEALTGSSELGQVMLFVEQSYGINQMDTLAKRFFSLTSNLNLNVALFTDVCNEHCFFSSSGIVKPLEKDLLVGARESNRFIDFGCRTIVNYPRVSLLVKNMPLNDAERYGRYKDLFPAVLGAMDAKVYSLETELTIIRHAQKLTESFQSVKETLVNLAGTLNSNQHASFDLMNSMYQKLEDKIPRLGLEEDQEKFVLDTVHETISLVTNTMADSDQTNKTLARVLLTMQKLVDEQNKIVEEVKQEKLRVQGEVHDIPEDDYQMDVELF